MKTSIKVSLKILSLGVKLYKPASRRGCLLFTVFQGELLEARKKTNILSNVKTENDAIRNRITKF